MIRSLLILMSSAALAVAGPETDPVTIKKFVGQPGDRIKVTRESKAVTRNAAGRVQDSVEETVIYVTEIVQTAPDGTPTELRRTFEKAVETKFGRTQKLPLDGKVVVIERKRTSYTFRFPEGGAVQGASLSEFTGEFNRSPAINDFDFYLPSMGVRAGDEWDVSTRFTDAFSDPFRFDRPRTKGTAKFIESIAKNGKGFATLSAEITAPLVGIDGLPNGAIHPGSTMNLAWKATGCIDGTVPDRVSTEVMKTRIVMDNLESFDETTTTRTTEFLPKQPGQAAPAQKPQRKPISTNADTLKGFALLCGIDGKRDLPRAYLCVRAAAEAGDPPAQVLLAGFCLDGFSLVSIDSKTAVAWLEKSAKSDYAPAQAMLAMAYLTPWTGIERDNKRGQVLLWKSLDPLKSLALNDDPIAGMALADLFITNRVLPETGLNATICIEKAVAVGYPVALAARAKAYAIRDKDYKRSLPALRELADLGHATAQTLLGMHYLEGHGTPIDSDQAKRWLKKAAVQGDLAGSYFLGEICEKEGNLDEALEAYSGPRKAKIPHALFRAGVLLAKSQEPEKQKEGLDLIREVADRDFVPAMFEMGKALENSNGRQAATWYEKAARRGHAQAQFHYGIMLDFGDVIPRNRAAAISWLRTAFANPGLPEGMRELVQFNLERVLQDND